MRIAFCTTVRGRTFHLKDTLPRNLSDRSHKDIVFVVLDYSSDDDLVTYLKNNHASDIGSGRLVVYSFPNATRFHLSHAKNMAMRCGILEGADLLCQLDADNYGGPGFAQFIVEKFSEREQHTDIFLCPDYLLIKSLPHGALRPARGYAGRLIVRAQTFVKIGGYSQEFSQWGREDISMNFTLIRAGYQIRHIPNKYLGAIGHGSAVRFKEYPEAQALYENGEQVDILKARTETIVNHGNFGCGTVYRNFDPTPIELKPLPTRVFGIGLHKSATTSLDEAFKKLGMDSLHWGQGEAPMIWYEMNALGRSPTLEKWYALCDMPIPLLYRQLDKAYPGSKFILTVRDEVAWLASVQKLWSYKHNPTRHLWTVYPISNVLHRALYGTHEFDALVFLERYRRHNREVLEYFRDRPDDLLVMDMDKGGDWQALCDFLGKPVPNVPYPRANQSNPLSGISSY